MHELSVALCILDDMVTIGDELNFRKRKFRDRLIRYEVSMVCDDHFMYSGKA